MKYFLIFFSILFITLTGCKKENIQPEPPAISLFKIGQVFTSGNLKVELFANDTLTAGYQKLYFKITDATGKNVSGEQLSFSTEMKMTSMTHSSPNEQPLYNSLSGFYEGAAVFTMPSGMDSWKIKLKINGENFDILIYVAPFKSKVVGSYTGIDGKRYVVSLIPNKKWNVGLNDLEILVNQMADMMNFPPQENLTINLTPEMPSMGHGSPNNTDPISIGNGHYKGKVNLTMTGDWRFHFKISKNGVVILNDATIDIFF